MHGDRLVSSPATTVRSRVAGETPEANDPDTASLDHCPTENKAPPASMLPMSRISAAKGGCGSSRNRLAATQPGRGLRDDCPCCAVTTAHKPDLKEGRHRQPWSWTQAPRLTPRVEMLSCGRRRSSFSTGNARQSQVPPLGNDGTCSVQHKRSRTTDRFDAPIRKGASVKLGSVPVLRKPFSRHEARSPRGGESC